MNYRVSSIDLLFVNLWAVSAVDAVLHLMTKEAG